MVAGRELTPKDAEATERLRHYWTEGPGAAIIAWGQPGDWARCVTQISRFVGPDKAKGECENLHERALGIATSTHAKLVRDLGHVSRGRMDDAIRDAARARRKD